MADGGFPVWRAVSAVGGLMVGVAAVATLALSRNERVVVVPDTGALNLTLVAPEAAPSVKYSYITGLDPKGDNWLALKSAPDGASDRLKQMEPDTLLTVLGEKGEWVQVQLPTGERGWAHSKYVACCKSADGTPGS